MISTTVPTSLSDPSEYQIEVAEPNTTRLPTSKRVGLTHEALPSFAAMASRDLNSFLRAVYNQIDSKLQPKAVYYRRQRSGDQVSVIERVIPLNDHCDCESYARVLDAACLSAQRSNTIEVRQQASPSRSIIAIPFETPEGDRDALGFVYDLANDLSDSTATHRWLCQSIVYQAVAWQHNRQYHQLDHEISQTAALLELIEQLVESTDLQQACYRLATHLQRYTKCGQVAVGFRKSKKAKLHLIALSGSAHFEKNSEWVSKIEALMELTVQKKKAIAWPNLDPEHPFVELAEKSLCQGIGVQSVQCTPVSNGCEQANFAIAFLDVADAESRIAHQQFLNAAATTLSGTLLAIRRSEKTPFARMIGRLKDARSTSKFLSGAAMICLANLAMLIPTNHSLQCLCKIEPVTCRFMAAPFDGTLEKTFVKPGDLVRIGDLLARMDGREIRWKRAGILADQNQASKKRDAAQANHSYADQQIAQLEMERLALELRLLDHRAENLEISSPVDGMVTSGDLFRVEGAPLSVGQTLFEIAPLEQMIAEVAIADNEIGYASIGQSVEMRIDAYPNQTWQAKLTKIQPRSEIRDATNVFIAEVELDNTEGRLRPGMKGRARVVVGHRAYGWILLHEPIEYLLKKLSW